MPEEIHAPLPDASLAGPSYFSNFQHRFYDPLSLKVPEGESESPSAYRHRGLLAGIVENEAQAPAPAPAMPPSVPSPLSAPTSPSSAQVLPAPALSSVPILAEDWSSGSDEGEEDVLQALAPAPLEPAPAPSPPAQVLPPPALSSVPILADEWSSGSDEGEENEAQAPAVSLETAPALLSVPILADDWSSGSDEEGSSGTDEEGSSGTDEEGKGGLAEEWSSASGKSEAIPAMDDVVENWSSASHGSGSGSSNTPLTLNT